MSGNSWSSDRDDPNRRSTQSESDEQGITSSDGNTSSLPDTNDDTTSDDCKPSSKRTENVADSKTYSDSRKPSASHQNENKGETSKVESFATQLMHMLNSEADAGSNAVQWLQDGSGFMIRDQQEFEQQILPRYFDTCIFQSFVRRLYR